MSAAQPSSATPRSQAVVLAAGSVSARVNVHAPQTKRLSAFERVDSCTAVGDTVGGVGLLIGDGVVHAADTIGQGVVTFGQSALRTSFNNDGKRAEWTPTSC